MMNKKLLSLSAIILIAYSIIVVSSMAAIASENPFSDVPTGHWAYDAVTQLSARGLLSGYPAGEFDGSEPATRYEMASAVARLLANVDLQKANKQDVELIKKLVVEFSDELDNLGVKVSSLDKRVAVLEDNLGGWKLSGRIMFDAKFGSGDNSSAFTGGDSRNEFGFERFDLYLSKQINDTTSFYANLRAGNDGVDRKGNQDYNFVLREVYVDTLLPYDVNFRVGRFGMDFEGEKGLYHGTDALFGNFRGDGFRFEKNFNGNVKTTAAIVRNMTSDYFDRHYYYPDEDGYMGYVADVEYTINERYMVGVTGYWFVDDGDKTDELGFNTYSVYARAILVPGIELKGAYYYQDLDDNWKNYSVNGFDDSPSAFKGIFSVSQDAFKWSSIWIEYSQQDGNFLGIDDRYSIGGSGTDYAGRNILGSNTTAAFWHVRLDQQWGDPKWSSYVKYVHVDPDNDYSSEQEWGLGVGYQMTPSIGFLLEYAEVDHGSFTPTAEYNGTNNLIRFRTDITF